MKHGGNRSKAAKVWDNRSKAAQVEHGGNNNKAAQVWGMEAIRPLRCGAKLPRGWGIVAQGWRAYMIIMGVMLLRCGHGDESMWFLCWELRVLDTELSVSLVRRGGVRQA